MLLNVVSDVVSGNDSPITTVDPSSTFWNKHGEKIVYIIIGIIIGIVISLLITLLLKKKRK